MARLIFQKQARFASEGGKSLIFSFPNAISGQIIAFHECKSVFPPTRNKSSEPIPLLLFCS